MCAGIATRRWRDSESTQTVFTLGDARSFSGLTSKIPPLGSMLNFDADVKKTTAHHQCENPCTNRGPWGLVHTARVVLCVSGRVRGSGASSCVETPLEWPFLQGDLGRAVKRPASHCASCIALSTRYWV